MLDDIHRVTDAILVAPRWTRKSGDFSRFGIMIAAAKVMITSRT
jgi:hypothetical protein